MREGKQDLRCAFLASSRKQQTHTSQLHWKDSYLVIEPGRLYLGRARAIRVTTAPGPLGREQPLRPGSGTLTRTLAAGAGELELRRRGSACDHCLAPTVTVPKAYRTSENHDDALSAK